MTSERDDAATLEMMDMTHAALKVSRQHDPPLLPPCKELWAAEIIWRAMEAARPLDPAIKPAAVEGGLVERLRAAADARREMYGEGAGDLYDEAAAAIASIREADVGRLRAVLFDAREDIDYACTAIMKLHEQKGRARLEQTLIRVDAALSDIGGV